MLFCCACSARIKRVGEPFLPTENGGFDVLDFSVLDTALKEVEHDVLEVYKRRASND